MHFLFYNKNPDLSRLEMIFIELKHKPAEIILRAVCGVLVFVTLFLLILCMIFSFGGDAPSVLGKNVYIVRTGAFDIIHEGTAVLTSEVPPAELEAGNIVIYRNSDSVAGLAEIQEAVLYEEVYSFTAMSEQGTMITLSQGQIVGKAMQYSDFLGALILFAKSPWGVFVIAVLPCVALLGSELVKFLMNFIAKEDEVSPVRKQDEVPTYIPRQKAQNALSTPRPPAPQKKPSPAQMYSAKAGATTDDDFPLFRAQAKVSRPVNAPERRASGATGASGSTLLSQKRLNQVIAETNAKRGAPPKLDELPANRPLTIDERVGRTGVLGGQTPSPDRFTPQRRANPSDPENPTRPDRYPAAKPPEPAPEQRLPPEEEIETTPTRRTLGDTVTEAAETLRRFTPRRQAQPRPAANTAAMPRLDSILHDDEDSPSYNIEDVLANLDRKRASEE